jgi:hypothetical protein
MASLWLAHEAPNRRAVSLTKLEKSPNSRRTNGAYIALTRAAVIKLKTERVRCHGLIGVAAAVPIEGSEGVQGQFDPIIRFYPILSIIQSRFGPIIPI